MTAAQAIIKLIQGLLTKGHPSTDLKAADIVVISMYAIDKLILNEKLKERAEFQEDLAEVRVLLWMLFRAQSSRLLSFASSLGRTVQAA